MVSTLNQSKMSICFGNQRWRSSSALASQLWCLVGFYSQRRNHMYYFAKIKANPNSIRLNESSQVISQGQMRSICFDSNTKLRSGITFEGFSILYFQINSDFSSLSLNFPHLYAIFWRCRTRGMLLKK